MRVIITCSCKGMPAFAEEAFKTLYPKEQIPKIYAGKSQILSFVDSLPVGNFSNYVRAFASNKERFAYLFEYDGPDLKTAINLKSGVRVC